jgi:hypothetical protein
MNAQFGKLGDQSITHHGRLTLEYPLVAHHCTEFGLGTARLSLADRAKVAPFRVTIVPSAIPACVVLLSLPFCGTPIPPEIPLFTPLPMPPPDADALAAKAASFSVSLKLSVPVSSRFFDGSALLAIIAP